MRLVHLPVIGVILSAGWSLSASAASPMVPDLTPRLRQALAEHQRGNPTVVGEAVTVMTPSGTWSAVVGVASGTQRPLTDRHTFRIASVTKPFVAASILRLMEMGRLDITRPIESYISADSIRRLRAGGYDPSAITVRQLLNHTSGIYDYATDPSWDAKTLSVNASRQWTRAEEIQHAMDHGKPYGRPGEVWGYSDTGYILLGEIIERQTGQNIGAAVRALLDFRRIGLVDTYWEQFEAPASDAPFSGALYGTVDMTRANHSFDLYGGGGLISSTRDLAKFFRALERGEVFRDPRTLAVLMTVPKTKRRPEDDLEGNGLKNFTVGRAECLGHQGFWGQFVAYCPEFDITFAWTKNSNVASAPGTSFRDKLAAVLDLN